jgi:indole-3-glycerol phosphate synthase
MDILTRIVAHKREEVADATRRLPLAALRRQVQEEALDLPRPFFAALRRPGPTGINIIAEIKRASPSKGLLAPDLDAAQTARRYAAGGAAALSVLTDRQFFKGSAADLQAARRATDLPVLRKDFLVDDYQIYESRLMGADAVLLICRILSAAQLSHLIGLSRDLALDTLVEIHSREDLAVAGKAGAVLIGINNRNLATFATDIANAMQLASQLSSDQVPVAASGIRSPADIQQNLRCGIFNFLIGETLVKAPDPVAVLRGLAAAGAPRATETI